MKLGIILGIAFWEGSLCAWEDTEPLLSWVINRFPPREDGGKDRGTCGASEELVREIVKILLGISFVDARDSDRIREKRSHFQTERCKEGT